MSVGTELTRIINAKAAIRSAIQARGVTVPEIDTLEDYAAYIAAIPGFSAPAAFTIGQWTATPGNTTIAVNVTALPDDGGDAIAALEYRLDGGSAVAFAGTGTGIRTITGLTNATEYDVEIRAVNAIGASAWSDMKAATPVAPSGAANWETIATTLGTINTTGLLATKPAGAVATDTLVAFVTGTTGTNPVLAPAGWTAVGVTSAAVPGFADLTLRAFTAPGDVAVTTFACGSAVTSHNNCNIFMSRVSGVNQTTPIREAVGRTSDVWGDEGPGGANYELDDMPAPSVTALASDAVLSLVWYPQTTNAWGTLTAGHTRVANITTTPNNQSVAQRSDLAGGATGEIFHGGNGAYSARMAMTIALAAA